METAYTPDELKIVNMLREHDQTPWIRAVTGLEKLPEVDLFEQYKASNMCNTKIADRLMYDATTMRDSLVTLEKELKEGRPVQWYSIKRHWEDNKYQDLDVLLSIIEGSPEVNSIRGGLLVNSGQNVRVYSPRNIKAVAAAMALTIGGVYPLFNDMVGLDSYSSRTMGGFISLIGAFATWSLLTFVPKNPFSTVGERLVTAAQLNAQYALRYHA